MQANFCLPYKELIKNYPWGRGFPSRAQSRQAKKRGEGMQDQKVTKKPRRPLKARHIVLFVISIILLIGSIAVFLAGAIGITVGIVREMNDTLENAEPLIPGAEGFAIMAYAILWIVGFFVLLVLLAVCWLIGLVLTVILAFFMRKKPIWLSVLSYILFAVYVILVLCIMIPVIPGLLILLFLTLFG